MWNRNSNFTTQAWIYSGLIVSIALIVAAYFWTTMMMDSLFAFRSPLKDTPPAAGLPAAPNSQSASKRVVFVLIDALRLDTSMDAAVMPALNSLREQGASAAMHSRPPSYSQPGYTTLLTGAWPEINDGPPINLETEEIPTFTQDDLFSAARRAGRKTAISGYEWFEKLVPQAAVDASFYTPGEDSAADRAVVDAALLWLRDGSYELLLIHIDQVDYAGHHEGGPRDPRWNEAAARADALLAEIAGEMNPGEDTLLIVSDHGQIPRGGHGGNEPVTLVEPFVLAGAGVKPGTYADMQMVDVAPTLAVLLGTNLPASGEGRPLLEMLAVSQSVQAAVEPVYESQQKAVAQAYREAIGMIPPTWTDETPGAEGIELAREARLARERLPRVMLAVLIALALGRLLWGIKADRSARLLGGLLYLVLFHLGYALVSGRTYSLSSQTGVNDLLLTAGGWAVAALALAAAVFIWRGGVLDLGNDERSAALMRFSMSVISLLLLPVLVSYALNGWLTSWTLPEFTSAFVSLLSTVQIMVVAAAGLALAWGMRRFRSIR
jgi:hypothetical protein